MSYAEDLANLAQNLAEPLWPWIATRIPLTAATWTPALVGDTTAGTFTYDTTNTGGEYTRIGNRVLFNGRVRITAISVAPAGNIYITLPLTASSPAFSIPGGATAHYWIGVTMPAGFTQLEYFVVAGSTQLRLARSGSAATASVVQGTDIALVAGVLDFPFDGGYRV